MSHAERLAAIPRELFYGGAWHAPREGGYEPTASPSTGETLGPVAIARQADVDAAVAAAAQGFAQWRAVPPLERARILRAIAARLREHADEFTYIDAANAGHPVREMTHDIANAAGQFEFFAGLVTEMKGTSIPMGEDRINFSVREPVGVVARIVPFNHPFMFAAAKSAAPLAAGNAVIIKPSDQAPLSALRLAQLVADLLPPGTFSVLPGDAVTGSALASHRGVASVGIIGSPNAGKAVMRAASDTVKPVLLELGGKNALIAYPDADPDEVAAACVAGMNFGWCGQSCGSTSRAFIHRDIHDAVRERIVAKLAAYKPGIPTDPATTMGAIVSAVQKQRVLDYIAAGVAEGATLVSGGRAPADPALARGHFVEPTLFAGVTQAMRIAREEIFGPVLSMIAWTDEAAMLRDVNSVDYGLTAAIWTRDIDRAYRTARAVQVGYVWINDVAKHFLGAGFGGVKLSGWGREECIEEMLHFTQQKNIHQKIRAAG